MKQKFLSMLTLLLVCCCHLQIRAAEIVAPVEPNWTETAVAPVSEHVYYIKCVDTGKYLYNYSSYEYVYSTTDLSTAHGYVLNKTTSGWTIYCADNGTYVSEGNYNYLSGTSTCTNNSYWIIDDESSAGGHYIMRTELNSYYSETYIGYWRSSNSNLYSSHSVTNAHKYVFVDAEVRERYLASKKLYDAICVAQGKNLYVPSYESFYNDRNNHTVAEIYAQARELISATNVTSYSSMVSIYNEVPLMISPISGNWSNNSGKATCDISDTDPVAIEVKFSVDNPSSFFWSHSINNSNRVANVEVLLDGEQIDSYNGYVNGYSDRYFVDVTAGEHTIRWNITGGTQSNYINMSTFAVMLSPQITVNLAEPGSLGTEVLYNVDGLKDVKSLKIIGRMNADDWAKIAMMDNILTLDLSEAVITDIPAKALSKSADTSFGFLHNVVLPEGLLTIGKNAFEGTNLKTVNIPSTVTTIGNYAFASTLIKTIEMPNSITSIGSSCFYGCRNLQSVTLSNQLTAIPSNAFFDCYNLSVCDLPEGITSVGYRAFYYNYNLSQQLPSTLQSIGDEAYYSCKKLCSNTEGELVIPKGVETIDHEAFYGCTDITTVDLPTKFYGITDSNRNIFGGCSNITKVILRSPTLITHKGTSGEYELGCDLSKVDLYVPDYLVPNYKLDEYWYNYKTITGFSTEDVQDWTINNPLVLSDRGRFLGTPDITINGHETRMPSLKINGDSPMTIKNLTLESAQSSYSYKNYSGQILSNCNNITITGDVKKSLWTNAKTWYFFSLPFDIKVSEITHSAEGVQKAIRYFDGANRAEAGKGGNWKNYDEDAVITAGTGFIMQTNVSTWNYFLSLNNANKQQIVKNVEFVKTLDVNDSQTDSNKGWNLVGNPWQCYYNDHALNFTGPITVWSGSTYSAYSITDDDYAIRPNEAFFVQCSGADYNTIGFPTQGRQLNAVIESQNAAKPMYASAQDRRLLVDVMISNGETEDKTRIVLNEKANLGYEMQCDASKMMSMDETVAQIYTVDADDTQYAINERPMDTGIVSLGIYVGVEGVYSLSLGRCEAETVTLIDYETGIEQTLTSDYTFTARSGYDNGRFALRFNADETTGITTVNNNSTLENAPCYNLAGQRIVRGTKGINIVGGRKVIIK